MSDIFDVFFGSPRQSADPWSEVDKIMKAQRNGVDRGFGIAVKVVAKMLESEGRPDLAERVRRMTLQGK